MSLCQLFGHTSVASCSLTSSRSLWATRATYCSAEGSAGGERAAGSLEDDSEGHLRIIMLF